MERYKTYIAKVTLYYHLLEFPHDELTDDEASILCLLARDPHIQGILQRESSKQLKKET